jgi:hypothetical protein
MESKTSFIVDVDWPQRHSRHPRPSESALTEGGQDELIFAT